MLQESPSPANSKTLCAFLLPTSLLSSVLLFSLLSYAAPRAPRRPPRDPFLFPRHRAHYSHLFSPDLLLYSSPPSIAYFISGSSGDSARITRLLLALYHPKNFYLLHLDLFASSADRRSLALDLQRYPFVKAANNVHVVGKADFAYPKGSSSISSILHGASILLRLSPQWDWFINLSAADYPLVTQDDLLHIFSYLPKNLNFVNHTSYIGWRESRRLKPIIVDPGLYLREKTQIFYASQKRDLPNAYKLFTGTYSVILSRSFVEHCIQGSDNFPRTLLMYLANAQSSLANYFPTVLCNSLKFPRTTVNHNLQYADSAGEEEGARLLNSSDFADMVHSGAAFATRFRLDDSVLDRIDEEILRRRDGGPVPGGWCLGDGNDTCGLWGDADVLRPGEGAKRLGNRIVGLLSKGLFGSDQCVVDH